MTLKEAFAARKEKEQAELAKAERQVYDLESNYLGAEYSQMGSVLKGLEGFLSSKEALKRRPRAYKLEDRSFSLSSKTSPATKELEQQEAEAAETASAQQLGRGKGNFALKDQQTLPTPVWVPVQNPPQISAQPDPTVQISDVSNSPDQSSDDSDSFNIGHTWI